MKVLVTGSSGLIGSEAVVYYDRMGHEVLGIDNNMRMLFFGPAGDTTWNRQRLERVCRRYRHIDLDIRDREGISRICREERPQLIVHCAAQPSHDKAREIPIVDFEVNALGTMHLLEAFRLYCPDAVFIHMSTNKVYGDAPNEIPLMELDTRYDYADPRYSQGIDENMRIDRSLHSLFGASKVAADIMAQEYGRYFGLKVGIFRGGCLTGPSHSGVELHGFLSYLVKTAVSGKQYTIYGYKGKQVRDQIHSSDVIAAFEAFRSDPRPGEVYNLGGGRENSASVIECIYMLEERLGRSVASVYDDTPRRGDHICYISDLRKLKSHFPQWRIERTLPSIIDELICAEMARAPRET